MVHETPIDYFKSDLERTKIRIDDGPKRIKAFYDPEFEKPGDYEHIEDEPPHEILIERGIDLIAFSALDLIDDAVIFPSPEYQSEKLLYGVGTESLLNGIHLLINPEHFVNQIQEPKWNTPTMKDSIDILKRDLKEKLPKDDYQIAKLYFELIRHNRNNEVHLGFHSDRTTYLRRLVLEVTMKLGSHYYGPNIPRKDEIESKISELYTKEMGTTMKIRFDEEGTLA